MTMPSVMDSPGTSAKLKWPPGSVVLPCCSGWTPKSGPGAGVEVLAARATPCPPTTRRVDTARQHTEDAVGAQAACATCEFLSLHLFLEPVTSQRKACRAAVTVTKRHQPRVGLHTMWVVTSHADHPGVTWMTPGWVAVLRHEGPGRPGSGGLPIPWPSARLGEMEKLAGNGVLDRCREGGPRGRVRGDCNGDLVA